MRTPVLRVEFQPVRSNVYSFNRLETYGHVNVNVNAWDDKGEDQNGDGQWVYNPPRWLTYGDDVSPFWRLSMKCQTDTEKMAADYSTGRPVTPIDRFYGINLEWTPSDG